MKGVNGSGSTDSSEPPDQFESAAPPMGSRILALLAVVVGGVFGGLIGYGFTDLQCTGSCSTWLGIGTLIGAVAAAVGVAVVAVLALRAMDEWETMQTRDTKRRHTRS